MKFAVHPYMRRIAKPLACVLALVALAFLTQVAPHSHATDHDEAACRLCQVAHLGVAPAISVATLSAPMVSFGLVAADSLPSLAEHFFGQSSSRAPPAVVL